MKAVVILLVIVITLIATQPDKGSDAGTGAFKSITTLKLRR